MRFISVCLVFAMAFVFHGQAMAKEKPRVLFLDLTAALVKPEEAKILTDMVSAELGQYDEYEAITSTDLRQMAALEAEKQSVGCSDSSCLAELAGAMGARYVIFGSVGKLGEKFILTLNLFDSVEAKAVSRNVVKAKELGAMSDKVPSALSELLRGKKLRNDMATADPAEEGRPFPVVRVLSGSALAAVGAGLALGWGLPAYNLMVTEQSNYDAANAAGTLTETQHNATRAANDAFNAGPVFGLYGGVVLTAVGVGYTAWVLADHFGEE
ncbi:MAG: hypothetical protein CMH56_16755 [Myxococcales bacterium]|nr:hypothetical protein [Myxococcales bacterium]